MQGVIVNALAVMIGGILGLLFRRVVPKNIAGSIFQALGLAVLVIGIDGSIKTSNPLLLVASLSIGSFLGNLLDLEQRMKTFGDKVESIFVKEGSDSKISKAFVSSSILYCTGAMAIVGSLNAGISDDYQVLYVKSLLDGISSVFFAITLGFGILLSSISVFIYQGFIVVCASLLEGVFTDALVLELSSVGSTLIIAIGLNMVGATKIKISNLLPAVIIPIIYFLILG